MKRADLRRLIALEEPLDALLLEAEESVEDPSAEPIPLRRADLERAPTQYLEGRRTSIQLQRRADALELRESVTYEDDPEWTVAEVLFHLATPELVGPISPEVVDHLGASVRRASSNRGI